MAHSGPKKQLQLAHYLGHPSYEVQAAALLSLALEGKGNPTWRNHFSLEARILEGLDALPDIKEEAERHFRHRYLLRTIGQAEIPSLYPHLYEALDSSEAEIVKQALLSMGQSRVPGMIPRLLPFLVQKAHRSVATQALLFFGHALPGYLDELQNKAAFPWEQLSLIPAVLGQIGSQDAVNALFELLDHPFAQVSQEAMRSLRNMRQYFPALTFNKRDIFQRVLLEANWYQDTLSYLGGQLVLVEEREQPPVEAKARQALIQLLERRLDRNLDRIFSLLGLNYPPEDIQTIYQGIQSSLPELRVNALEFLDNLLEPNFKKVLIPLVETSMMETISEEAVRKLKLAVPDESQCFESLLRGKDEAVSLAVLRLISTMQDPRFLPLLEASLGEQWHPKVERRAREVMEQLRGE
jgi:AAA family ATP:ADP antiporter